MSMDWEYPAAQLVGHHDVRDELSHLILLIRCGKRPLTVWQALYAIERVCERMVSEVGGGIRVGREVPAGMLLRYLHEELIDALTNPTTATDVILRDAK